MIGGEPYTLGLFDTAGTPFLQHALLSAITCSLLHSATSMCVFFRSGRLWQVTAVELSTDRRVPGLFLCRLPLFLWKCQRKGDFFLVLNSYIPCHTSVDQQFVICPWTVGSRDHPPLSKDTLPAGGDSDWLAGWPVHHREAGQEQAEAHHSGDGWEAGERPQGCKICGVLSTHTGTWL